MLVSTVLGFSFFFFSCPQFTDKALKCIHLVLDASFSHSHLQSQCFFLSSAFLWLSFSVPFSLSEAIANIFPVISRLLDISSLVSPSHYPQRNLSTPQICACHSSSQTFFLHPHYQKNKVHIPSPGIHSLSSGSCLSSRCHCSLFPLQEHPIAYVLQGDFVHMHRLGGFPILGICLCVQKSLSLVLLSGLILDR